MLKTPGCRGANAAPKRGPSAARPGGRGGRRGPRAAPAPRSPRRGRGSGEPGTRAAPKAALKGWAGKEEDKTLRTGAGERGSPRSPPPQTPPPRGDPSLRGDPLSDPPAGCRPALTSLPRLPLRTLPERPPLGAPLRAAGSPSRRLAPQPRGDSPSSLRLAPQPLARCRSSFISTHHPPPFSSQLSCKSETRCSARSRHSRRRCLLRRRRHRLSRRGYRRRCGRAEGEPAAGTSARAPPGYVVPGPRPALPVPGGLARPGLRGVPCPRLPRREGVAAWTLGRAFARLPPGSRGGAGRDGMQPYPSPNFFHTYFRSAIYDTYGAFIVCKH